MDIAYSEEQNLIAQQAREFFERECPLDKVRGYWALEDGLPEDLWRKMAGMGWLGAMFPEEFGGMGLGHTDLSRVLEEAGRALLPGPLLGHLMGGAAVLAAGDKAQRQAVLPKAASGELRLALARCGEGGRLDRLGGDFRYEEAGGDFRLSGEKLAVPGLAQAGQFVVQALPGKITGQVLPGNTPPVKITQAEGSLSLFLVAADAPGVTVRRLETLDGGLKQASLTLDAVNVPGAARLSSGSEATEETTEETTPGIVAKIDATMELALAFDALGGAQRVLEMTVEYARLRTAFGNPIGTYQAVKHKCADMLYAVENLRAIAIWAAWVLDVPPGESGADPAAAVAMARATAIEGYNLAIKHGTQIHGAIGVTEEHDMHLFAKRAKTLGLSFGSLAHCHEVILRQGNPRSTGGG